MRPVRCDLVDRWSGGGSMLRTQMRRPRLAVLSGGRWGTGTQTGGVGIWCHNRVAGAIHPGIAVIESAPRHVLVDGT